MRGLAIWAAVCLLWSQGAFAEGLCGGASWYSYTGRLTANGEHFDGSGMTAASKTLPMGTRVRVTVVDPRPKLRRLKGHSVVVRINDRGPYVAGRIIDLSKAAAGRLGMIDAGAVKVCLTTL